MCPSTCPTFAGQITYSNVEMHLDAFEEGRLDGLKTITSTWLNVM